MREILKQICKDYNIEYVGIAPPGPYIELKEILAERVSNGFYTGFEEKDIEKRVDPSLTMKDVESIIVCLFPYYTGNFEDTNISKYAYSHDYHRIVKEKLDKIGMGLKEHIKDLNYMSFVDTGPLVDRYLAYLAGLGFWGINNHIITDKYGSYFFIGYILNNYSFKFDKPQERTCIKCGECIKKCPGGAILGDFRLNPTRCLSFITQRKGELSETEISYLNNNKSVFGCDICQDVCPHNKNMEVTAIDDFKKDLIYRLDYKELSTISNKEFIRKYGDRAFSWRGRKIIVRNFQLLKSKE